MVVGGWVAVIVVWCAGTDALVDWLHRKWDTKKGATR
jgi:hypothetical protein